MISFCNYTDWGDSDFMYTALGLGIANGKPTLNQLKLKHK